MKELVNDRKQHYLAVTLSGKSDKDALTQMAKKLYEEGYVKNSYEEAIIKREEQFPTGLPTGEISVAIPHTDPEHVITPAICLGILDEPMEFHVMGMEGEMVNVQLLFMLAIKRKEDQLGLLQKLIELCQNQEVLRILVDGNQEQIQEVMESLM